MDFGLTSYYQFARKALFTLLIGVSGPLIYFSTPITLTSAAVTLLFAARLFLTNLDHIDIDTSFIESFSNPKFPIQSISRRIKTMPEVISLNDKENYKKSSNYNKKLVMPENKLNRGECLLADQFLIKTYKK
jgi:hypothetical protein